MQKVSLSGVKVIDVHAHPFAASEEEETAVSFLRKLSLSVSPGMFTDIDSADKNRPVANSNMWIQILLRHLSRYLDCEENVETIVKKRNEQAADYSAYTKKLFEDVNLKGAIMDFGYPQPPLDRVEFEEMSGTRIWEISRIEPIMVKLGEEGHSFEAFIAAYKDQLKTALEQKGVVGLKTIIAYRSGLDVQPADEKAAEHAYREFTQNTRAAAKPFRDYCFHLALEACTEADKVLHIHTGVGDGDVVLTKASPGFLFDTLRMEKYADTKVHLVHGGYPWIGEAAFIVSVLPNVYLDLSLQNPFAGHGVERIISEVFEFAPFNKVMYGSDAFTVPEMNWMGVKLFITCFERVLNEWVEKDYMSPERARYIGEMVLYRNFETVYGVTL